MPAWFRGALVVDGHAWQILNRLSDGERIVILDLGLIHVVRHRRQCRARRSDVHHRDPEIERLVGIVLKERFERSSQHGT